jgi:excisionase family DNA binding protein
MREPLSEEKNPKQLLITIDEAAKRLSIGRSHIYALMQRGGLRSVHIGRSRRVLEGDLDAFIEQLAGDPDAIPHWLEPRHRELGVKSLSKRPGRR